MQYFSEFSSIICRSNHWNMETCTTDGLRIHPKWFIVSRYCTATKNGSLLWSDSYCRHILVVTSFVKRQPQSYLLLHKITFTMHDEAIQSRTMAATHFWNKHPHKTHYYNVKFDDALEVNDFIDVDDDDGDIITITFSGLYSVTNNLELVFQKSSK